MEIVQRVKLSYYCLIKMQIKKESYDRHYQGRAGHSK